MPDLQKEVSVKFTSKSDDAALMEFLSKMQGANVQISAAGETAKKAAEGADTLGTAFGELGKKIAGLFAIETITAYLKDATLGAIAEAREINQLTFAVETFDKKEAAAAGKIERFTAFMLQQGVADSTVRKSILEILPAAGSLDNAMKGVTLALDISAKTGMNLDQALSGVQRLMLGSTQPIDGVRGAFYRFGLEAKTADGALKELHGTMGGALANLQDEQKGLDQLKQMWHEFADSVGARILGLVEIARRAKQGIIKALGIGDDPDVKAQLVEAETIAKEASAKVQDYYKQIQEGTFDPDRRGFLGIKPKDVKDFENAVRTMEYYQKRVAELRTKIKEDESNSGAPDKNPNAPGKSDDKAAKAAIKSALDLANALKELREVEAREAEENLRNAEGKDTFTRALKAAKVAVDAESKAVMNALTIERGAALKEAQDAKASKETIAKINDTYDAKELAAHAKLKAALSKLDKAAEKEFENIEKKSEDFTKKEDKRKENEENKHQEALKQIKNKYAQIESKATKKNDVQRIKEEKATLAKLHQEYVKANGENLAEQEAYKNASISIDKQIAAAKVEMALGAVQQVAGIATALFGQNKKVAIAATIIDTIAASVKAYNEAGGGWWGLIPMAFTLATGYARVREIQKTEPGSGEGSSSAGGGGGGGGSAPSYSGGGGGSPSASGYSGMVTGASGGGGNFQDNRNTSHGPTINWSPMLLTRTDAERGFRVIERRLITAKVQNRRARLGGNKRYGGKVGYRGRV